MVLRFEPQKDRTHHTHTHKYKIYTHIFIFLHKPMIYHEISDLDVTNFYILTRLFWVDLPISTPRCPGLRLGELAQHSWGSVWATRVQDSSLRQGGLPWGNGGFYHCLSYLVHKFVCLFVGVYMLRFSTFQYVSCFLFFLGVSPG